MKVIFFSDFLKLYIPLHSFFVIFIYILFFFGFEGVKLTPNPKLELRQRINFKDESY